MKKILSKSKMREVLQLPHDKIGKARTAVFIKHTESNPVYTDLSDSDFKFLKDKENGPFSFLLKEGTFIVVDDNDDEPPTKLDIEIDKLLAEKEKREGSGKKFKSESVLKKLLDKREEAKTRQGE